MKKLLTLFVFCFLCGECFPQAGEWVWVHGTDTTFSLGHFGMKGVPSPTNVPPAMYEPCEWTDLNGNFWMFGGWNHYFNGASLTYADLWKYDLLTNEWTWMKGPGTTSAYPGVFGIHGVPAQSNNPPALSHGSATWVDNQGDLWMFGGVNVDYYSDLWKYDISTHQWTWMKGPQIPGQLGIYGVQGIPAGANNPGARYESSSAWTDNSNNLWLFGGHDYNQNYVFNDLWRFNIATNEWTWMKGSQLPNQGGVYGTLGVEDSLNTPGARWSYSHWKDNLGRFWLFGGGNGFSQSNDLWRYNPTTNNWAWIGGSDTSNSLGSYGIKCITASTNIPRSRFENRASWTDQFGNFWFFGGMVSNNGYSLNDLWMYCVARNEWVWVSGDSILNPQGNWGVLGVSSPTNIPNGRGGAVSWTDNNGHLYFFGGSSGPFPKTYNDLWKYTIDTACVGCNINIGIQEKNFTNELLVFPNPTNSSLTISFSSSEKQNIELRIYNTLGKQIYSSKEEITKGKFEKEINVEKWSGGIYFLQVKMKDGVVGRKIVVNHP